jgi:hypothetical protein
MDTEVQNVNHDALIDLFPGIGNNNPLGGKVNFGGSQDQPVDIFASSTTDDTTLAPSTTDDTTLAPSTTEETTESATGETTIPPDADILGAGKGPPEVKTKTTALSDLPAYYEERIKNGKFVAIQEVDDKGNKVNFIPKTAEEYDEVLELQIDYRVNEAKKDLEKKWFDSKSPAWKAISQYAEMVDDPTQLIPFLSGVKMLQSVADLNEGEIEGAEAIVRTRMEQRGDPEEVIASQIEALKTTDKLLATAKQYKPIIIQQEQQALQQQMRQQQQLQEQYVKTVSEVRNNAIAAIEKPIFGKQVLKKDEKFAIYELIAEPSEEDKGYGIYSAIDSLFDKKDFETLKELAFLIAKKEAFYNYLGTTVRNDTVAQLTKKLILAGETHKGSGNDFDEDTDRPTVTRNQFNKKPSFGRG